LVNFIGGHRKKTLFKYVCLVQSMDDDDGDVIVQGLKQEDCIRTQFSINDGDMSTITLLSDSSSILQLIESSVI